jgi:hypothetical protein
MSKTPEEMAEEYSADIDLCCGTSDIIIAAEKAFFAGYKAAQQWISVEDRLPEERVWVLGYYSIYENDMYHVGVVQRFVHTWAEANIWLTNHKNGPLTYEEVDLITYWQPLPAPPKEEA